MRIDIWRLRIKKRLFFLFVLPALVLFISLVISGYLRDVSALSKPAESLAPVNGIAGKWDGPEGTYLRLSQDADKFIIEIKSLHGSRVYEGKAVNNLIQFVRDGQTETIKKGSGTDTEMKWLSKKNNCLVINPGEGYCRD